MNNQRLYENIIIKTAGPMIALLLALIISAVIIALSGVNPLIAFKHMYLGSFGGMRNFTNTLVKATPLMLAGLGLVVSYRTGLISIGAEGQIVFGGFIAALCGVYLGFLPGVLLIIVMIIGGAVGGGFWGAIPGYLKAKLGVSEVINTIMLNYIAIYLIFFMVDGPFRDPAGFLPQSPMIAARAWLPRLIPRTRLHFGFVIALAGALIVWFILWRSPLGFQMRAVGYNREAARFCGIKVKRNLVLAMFISGGFAGIAGMSEIGGLHHRLISGFSSEYGYDAMAVALLGRKHPLGTIIAAVFFGALRVGAGEMQRVMQVPGSLIFIIQGLIILFVLLEEIIGKSVFNRLFGKNRIQLKEA